MTSIPRLGESWSGTFWRHPEPRRAYDVVIVGAGGHGLATAYYLSARFGISDVAVLDMGWLGGGNMARNTTLIRSNYLWDESASLFEASLKLWEELPEELGYPIQISQRGVLALAHSLHDVRESQRRVYANATNGIDAEWLDPEEVAAFCPIVNVSASARYPVLGGALQRRGGIAKHDQVAWALARRADRAGVDLIEHCRVIGFEYQSQRMTGVRTSLGTIATRCVVLCVAGHTTSVAALAGLELPIQSYPLQALVTELYEPIHPCVIMSDRVHVYVSQAHKGELVMGAARDAYLSYRQRGSFGIIERQVTAALELFPVFATARVLRTWAGIVDVSPDASPIIGSTPIEGLYLNCGWGTGGFKATPIAGMILATLVATGALPDLATPFQLERFVSGALIDEHRAAGVAH
jgi:sarcosine oxidase, subunit beta